MKKLAANIIVLLSLAGLVIAINQTFLLSGAFKFVIPSETYLYCLVLIFFPLTFILLPRTGRDRETIGWFDWLLFLAAAGCGAYLIYFSEEIVLSSWQFIAPLHGQIVALLLWALVLEGARRTNGWPLTIVVFLVSLYPLVADHMPGPLNGSPMAFLDLFAFHMFSFESVFGVPMKAFADLVIGFIVFGLALQHTGAGKFFNDLAFALMGRVRGGAAHVAVVSSALQASISGSVISNVVTSGSVTIPAMKRSGFAPSYAGGVEAVASTGGVLTPPVMGTTAFIMATFLNRPYTEIAVAAAIPALLFYLGLLMQVDAYAARRELKGLPANQLPTLRAAFAEGWHYCLVFAALITMLAQGMNESRAAFYATGLLIVVNQYKKENRLGLAGFKELLVGVGRGLTEIIAVILAIGMIAGALAATGILSTLSTDLVYLAGDAPIMLLLMGALTSFVLGMGMTVSACYIFLAIVLVPALVKVGFNALAVHMFVMYWGMLSFVTPPVAIATFAAATIARVSPFSIGWHSMRLASVMYFIPFFFVLNPALIMQGEWSEIIPTIGTAIVGIAGISWALQGYVLGIGATSDNTAGWVVRALLLIGGLIMAAPGSEDIGLNHWQLAGVGGTLMLVAILAMKMVPGRAMRKSPAPLG